MRPKLNGEKKPKILHLSPEAIDKLSAQANAEGMTFKVKAQIILENAAKRIKPD